MYFDMNCRFWIIEGAFRVTPGQSDILGALPIHP